MIAAGLNFNAERREGTHHHALHNAMRSGSLRADGLSPDGNVGREPRHEGEDTMKKMLIVLTLMLGAAPALAADLDASNSSTSTARHPRREGNRDLSRYAASAINALMQPLSQEDQSRPDSGDEKVRRDTLARSHLEQGRRVPADG